MQKACVVHDMNSVTDYRRLAHHHRGLYFADDQKEEELQARFKEVAAPNPTRPIRVDVIMGRTLDVKQAGKPSQLLVTFSFTLQIQTVHKQICTNVMYKYTDTLCSEC